MQINHIINLPHKEKTKDLFLIHLNNTLKVIDRQH